MTAQRIGGVSAVVLAVGYLAVFVLFAAAGAPPSAAEVWLPYLQGKTAIWWGILALSVFTDFLYIPVALALYFSLERIHKFAMLAAGILVTLFVALDLAVTWTNYAALLTLSGQFSAAVTDAQRAACLAAARYPAAILASRIEVFYAIVDLSFAILVIGCVMLKSNGAFGKASAWLGIAAGLFGIASVSTWFPAIILNALLTTAWLLLIGVRLCGLARQPTLPR